ncbi:MAG TPA: hypothetical protein PKH77_04985 [Anaerolineae bacterium]|nr:hypothetical protein [Anaerolineae bacterium]
MTTMTTLTQVHSALDVARYGLNPAQDYQKLRGRLDVYDEALLWTRYLDDGRASTYEVSPLDVGAAFADLPLVTGILPPDCLWYRKTGGEQVGLYVAPQAWTLRDHEDTVFESVPLPGLVFCGAGGEYRVFAVKHRPVDASEGLFHAPLPNVFRDGRICKGSAAFPACTLRTVHAALKLFMVESAFSDHLRGGRCKSYDDDVRGLWATLAGQPEFPEGELLPAKMQVGQLWAL